MLESLPREQGIYALLLRVNKKLRLTIGSLGNVEIGTGVYCYIGSARGLGGIRARIAHHLRKPKSRLWWHIDYLTTRDEVRIIHVIYAVTDQDLESCLAKALCESQYWSPAIPRFGATDRHDYTHLFRCQGSLELCLDEVRNALRRLGAEPKDLEIPYLDNIL